MKKLAIGCGVIILVLGIGTSIALYVVAHKASTYLRESGVLASLQTLSKGVNNQTPFTPPASGELTEHLMKRFAAVQESMYAKMGGRFHEIAAMQDEMMRRERAERREATASESAQNVTAMMSFVLQAQGAWIDALNEQRFSMDEYQWVRGRVYAAAGLHAVELGTRNLAEAIRQGGAAIHPIPVAGPGDPVSEQNKKLVLPYLPRMKDWAVLGFFGL